MEVPEKTKLAGDTCLKDTVIRFYKQHQEDPDKWDEPLERAKNLVNFYHVLFNANHKVEYYLYYKAMVEILEIQEITPAPIKITGGTNSIRR